MLLDKSNLSLLPRAFRPHGSLGSFTRVTDRAALHTSALYKRVLQLSSQPCRIRALRALRADPWKLRMSSKYANTR